MCRQWRRRSIPKAALTPPAIPRTIITGRAKLTHAATANDGPRVRIWRSHHARSRCWRAPEAADLPVTSLSCRLVLLFARPGAHDRRRLVAERGAVDGL